MICRRDDLKRDPRRPLDARYAGLIPPDIRPYPVPPTDVILRHRGMRRFCLGPLPSGPLEWLVARAQTAPSKSDLLGISTIAIESSELLRELVAPMPRAGWVAEAPRFVARCPNTQRDQEVYRLHWGEHRSNTRDMLVNVSADTTLCMRNSATAPESLALGACNASAVRPRPDEVGARPGLPPGVYPLAGTCVGYPAEGQASGRTSTASATSKGTVSRSGERARWCEGRNGEVRP